MLQKYVERLPKYVLISVGNCRTACHYGSKRSLELLFLVCFEAGSHYSHRPCQESGRILHHWNI